MKPILFSLLAALAACSSTPMTSLQDLQAAQAQAQARVAIACAGLTALADTAPDVTHRVANNISVDCASAQATAKAISDAIAANPAVLPSK